MTKTDENGESTITFDETYLNSHASSSSYVELARAATHEADHALQYRAFPSLRTTTSFADFLHMERSSWRTETMISAALMVDAPSGIWTVNHGWDSVVLEGTALSNAAADCALIVGGCTP